MTAIAPERPDTERLGDDEEYCHLYWCRPDGRIEKDVTCCGIPTSELPPSNGCHGGDPFWREGEAVCTSCGRLVCPACIDA